MATVVHVPASPNRLKGIAQLTGTILGHKLGQARAKERSESLLDSLEEFTGEKLDPQVRAAAVRSGQIQDWDDLADFMALQRSQEESATVTRTTPEGTFTFERPVSREALRAGQLSEEERARGLRLGTPVKTKEAERVTFFDRDDPAAKPIAYTTLEDRPKGGVTLEELKQIHGTAAERGDDLVDYYEDSPKLEFTTAASQESRPKGAITLAEWKAKYDESGKSKTDAQLAMERLVAARGLELNPVTLNAARVDIKEANRVEEMITSNFAERFGENFNFGSQQGRRLFNRAVELYDDILWGSAEQKQVLTAGEVASAAVRQAERELGPPDQPDPGKQLETLKGERSEEEQPGPFERVAGTLGLGGGQERPTVQPLDTAKNKVSSLPDADADQLSELLAFDQYTRARELLVQQGLSEEEAREWVIWAAENKRAQ